MPFEQIPGRGLDTQQARDIATGADGSIFVTDMGSGRVFKWNEANDIADSRWEPYPGIEAERIFY